MSLENSGNPYLYFFIGGAGAYIHRASLELSKPARRATSLLVITSVVYLVLGEYARYGAENFIVMSVLFLGLIVLKPKWLESKPLVLIGEISYSLYLVHLTVFYLYAKFISAYVAPHMSGWVGFYTILMSFGVVVVLVSSITFKWIEYPFIRRRREKFEPEEFKSHPISKETMTP